MTIIDQLNNLSNEFANHPTDVIAKFMRICGIIWTCIIIILFIRRIVSIIRKNRLKQQRRQQRIEFEQQLDALANNVLAVTPQQFWVIRRHPLSENFTGVYIIYNKSKDMYYVGQAKQVLSRVNAHFTGKGNGDVYADYKYGDEFTIRMISLKNSEFHSLNELERHMIAHYNAFDKGYNKTRGNKN